MPVLSHLHQLFNAEQCQTYIHTLRWKDRPLQCGPKPTLKPRAANCLQHVIKQRVIAW